MEMETPRSFETFVLFYHITCCDILENRNARRDIFTPISIELQILF